MNPFIEMSTFIAVVENQGISKAAQRLRIGKSVVSTRIQHLEKRLGVSLLERGRLTTVTEAGQEFYDRAVQILAEVTDAEESVRSVHASLQGTLRIAVSMVFSLSHLDDILTKFMRLHPNLLLELHTSDDYINLQEERFDAAIRLGSLVDSSLIARVITPNTLVMCASPDYLKHHGHPNHPNDLQHHYALFYRNREFTSGFWHLPENGQLKAFRIQPRLRTDNGFQLLAAAKAGLGITILPTFLAHKALEHGELQVILPQYSPAGSQLSVVYRQSKRASPKIKALIDFLNAEIGNPPYWERKIHGQLSA